MAGETGNSEIEKFGSPAVTETDSVEAAFNDLLNQ